MKEIVKAEPPDRDEGAGGRGLALVAAALLILVLKWAVIDRADNPLRHSNLAGNRRPGQVAADVAFDGQFHLLGYDALPGEVAGDRSLEVRLYWQDAVPGGPDYRVGLTLQDAQGSSWSDPDLRPLRWDHTPPPAYLWPPDEYALTSFELRLLPGAPPGVYTVTLGVFDGGTLTPYTAGGTRVAVPLHAVYVTRPRRPLAVGEVSAGQPADVPFGPLRLVGYDLDRVQAAPGDPFLLTLFWRADETPQEDARLELRLLDPAGATAATFDLSLVRDDWPVAQWRAGDLWRGQHGLRLPAGLESGEYRWVMRVCRAGGEGCRPLGEEMTLGALQVRAPQRLWSAPPLDVETDALLGGAITLLGATLEPATCNLKPETCNLQPATSLTVTLVWRAERDAPVSYRVFLHLLGPDGELVAQSDGEPADWTRPTTGWLPGEIVLDRRVLTLPAAGEYTLRAGMYTLAGGRLTTPEGADAVLLGRVMLR